jgi:predicted O-methyltransferase YrrM
MNNIDRIKQEFGKYWSHPKDIGSQGVLEGTKYAGRKTNLRSQVYTLVRLLNAQNCLEIGSWHYCSSNAMGDALDSIGASGVVDTFDIMKGGYDGAKNCWPKSGRVRPHFWLPHHTNQDVWKYDKDVEHKDFKTLTNDEIFAKNLAYLKSIAPANGYDLILIDGDHSFEGASWDWKYTQEVSRDDTVFIIDDIWDSRLMPCRDFFNSLKTTKWDFEEWNDDPNNYEACQNSGVALRV